MAFRVVRLRREARRLAKLEEIFTEKDRNQSGSLHVDQVAEIFRVYEVNLDEAAVQKVITNNGQISKADFVKLATDLKLLDFGGPMGESQKRKLTTQKKELRIGETDEDGNYEGLNWLCCCTNPRLQSPEMENGVDEKRDRVLVAFSVWDTDGDGFLSWEEFQKISNNTSMSQEQALRIFQHCDKTGRGKVSLEEFREAADSKPHASRRPRCDSNNDDEKNYTEDSNCDQYSCA